MNGGALATTGCSGIGGGGYNYGNYHSYCDRLNSGATFTATYTFNPQGTGALNASATVSSLVSDPNSANNRASVTTVVTGAADMAVTMSASSTLVRAGSNLTYSIVVKNNGPDTAIWSTLSDTLPAGVSIVSATASSGWSCYYYTGGSNVTCNFGDMPSGTSQTVSLVVKPSVSGTHSNTASVSSNVTDPVTANNSATTTVTVK